ncbi:MAG: BatA domain-containing protein, partial [Longimicrobiales bacterium]
MSFLAPLFLIGLAGLAIPVLIHLTRHERGKPVEFPSLMFLERIPFQETSRRRIRHWALLLMRLAALALLVAAFARPFVRTGRLAGVGGLGPEEVVLMVDNSYSMGLEGVWEDAVERSKSALSALGPLDRVSLIAFSETPHLLHRSTTDHQRLVQALDTLTAGSLATRIAPAVKLAASTLAASTLSRHRVVMVSDFQRTAWRPDQDAVLPEGVLVETIVIGDGEVENLALSDLVLDRTLAAGRDRVAVEARLVNPTDRELETTASLVIDETEVQTFPVTVAAGGAARLSFDAFTLTQPFTRGLVAVTDEGLADDNVLSFVVSPGGNISILVVDPAGAGDSNLYLRQALGIAEGSGFQVNVVRNPPTAGQLVGTSAVVLNGAPFPSGDAGSRLREFVDEGGGLLMVLGDGTRVPADQADFLPVTVGAVSDAGREPRRLGFVDYDHAVFEAFRGARSGDFSKAAFYRSRALTAAETGRVLARFDDGSIALAEGRVGRGRVLIWATGLDRFWNNFPLQPVYLPFIHQLATYLGGQGEVPPWHEAGSTVDIV